MNDYFASLFSESKNNKLGLDEAMKQFSTAKQIDKKTIIVINQCGEEIRFFNGDDVVFQLKYDKEGAVAKIPSTDKIRLSIGEANCWHTELSTDKEINAAELSKDCTELFHIRYRNNVLIVKDVMLIGRCKIFNKSSVNLTICDNIIVGVGSPVNPKRKEMRTTVIPPKSFFPAMILACIYDDDGNVIAENNGFSSGKVKFSTGDGWNSIVITDV